MAPWFHFFSCCAYWLCTSNPEIAYFKNCRFLCSHMEWPLCLLALSRNALCRGFIRSLDPGTSTCLRWIQPLFKIKDQKSDYIIGVPAYSITRSRVLYFRSSRIAPQCMRLVTAGQPEMQARFSIKSLKYTVLNTKGNKCIINLEFCLPLWFWVLLQR